jgi:hypothetical protein
MLPDEKPVLIPGTFHMISISRAVVSTVTELHIEHKVQKNVNVITEGTNICACMTHTVQDSDWHVSFSFLSTCLLQAVDAQAKYSRHLRCIWNVATGTQKSSKYVI